VKLAVLTTHAIQYHAAWFRALAAHPGIDLEILYCHQASPKEQAEAGFGVEFDWDVSLLDGYPHRFLRNVARRPGIAGFSGLDTPEIKDIIARERFDAVMINGWHYKSAWQAMRACWKTGTPVMVRSDSHLHTERPLFKRIAKRPFHSWFISKLDACLPVGKWSSDYFLHYGAAPERVVIVPHVVDTDYFKSELDRLTPRRQSLRAQWGLDDSAVVFLFAGKFIEKKRPLDFVYAVKEAGKTNSQVAGLMVGDGPLRGGCEDLVRKENLPIKFAGFLNQSRMASAYVAADALILPSDGGETWGLVVNEAMACGVPCFVSDKVGCGPDMIITGETGAVFSLGDTKALGALLSEFAPNKKQMGWMQGQAKKQAQKYTVSVAVDRIVMAVETATR
jgi:glycosyltransferase involved in cell wall biosynthesis